MSFDSLKGKKEQFRSENYKQNTAAQINSENNNKNVQIKNKTKIVCTKLKSKKQPKKINQKFDQKVFFIFTWFHK